MHLPFNIICIIRHQQPATSYTVQGVEYIFQEFYFPKFLDCKEPIHLLTCFVSEVQKQNSEPQLPSRIHILDACSLQRHLKTTHAMVQLLDSNETIIHDLILNHA